MSSVNEIFSALAFDSSTRLYRVEGDGELSELMVEAWACKDSLSTPWELQISTLSTRAGLGLQAMLGKKLTLQTVLADGSLHPRSGIVTHATSEAADGGFARYTLTVRPWIALLAHTRQSRVWQEKPFVELIESVLARYASTAQWRWSDDIAAHLAQSPFSRTNGSSANIRSYTVQYRETDLDFITRLLAEEGIAWRIEKDDSAPAGHSVVFFADSVSAQSCPEDATSAAGANGIKFHRASAIEEADAVQALGGLRIFQSATSTVLAWDYAAKRSVAASVPTRQAFGGESAPRLEHFEPAHAYAYANSTQADRAGVLRQEALEARNKTWLGRSTVRTLTAGHRFKLTDGPLQALGDTAGEGPERRTFVTTAVTSVGINNLPKELSDKIASAFWESGTTLLPAWVDAAVREQVAATGYANAFEAIRADVPWRPAPIPRPTAAGPMLATVVGADGASTTSPGSPEIHTDRLGRIRIRHEFQPAGEGSTWVRVMQPYAGAGMGHQFIPRIGQQVLIGFFDDDLERPCVQGALFTGRGEGGIAPTPGGQPGKSGQSADTAVFATSNDHRPAGQGNLAGGNAPPWHGAGSADITAGGQANAAALSGWKTQEFNGQGFNQLVFDDSNQQLRTQLATTQHATQLNLGHLIHQADNHRGSFRGLGFELRTDAYGTLRGQQGVLLSTFAVQPNEPAGDNAAGIALAGQLKTLAQTFSEAAKTHQTVQFASHLGSSKAGQSSLSDKEALAQAMHTALKGMVGKDSLEAATSDAGAKNTGTQDKLPHTTDPVVAISAKAGLAIVAGQDVALAAGETLLLGAGQDANLATGGAMRLHSGQAIGVLAGAIAAGTEASGKGITLIAGQGAIEVQAQADTLQIAAKEDVSIQSKTAHIDWAAAKKIVLATQGGASITIEGGNITVQCPGTITVRASTKSFIGPEMASYSLPVMPRSQLPERSIKFDLRLADVPGLSAHGLANTPWKLCHGSEPAGLGMIDQQALIAEGQSDAQGAIKLTTVQEKALAQAWAAHPDRVWLVYPGQAVRLDVINENPKWSEEEKLLHALNAGDFSDQRLSMRGVLGEPSITRYAKRALEVSKSTGVFNRIKS